MRKIAPFLPTGRIQITSRYVPGVLTKLPNKKGMDSWYDQKPTHATVPLWPLRAAIQENNLE